MICFPALKVKILISYCMNKYLIDTSSLLILARYYHPFDKEKILYKLLRDKVREGVIVFLDSVEDECRRVAKGKVVQTYQFLNKKIKEGKGYILNPEYVKPKSEPNKIATSVIHKKIVNNWLYGREKKELANEEFESEKAKAIQGADFQLIFTAMEIKSSQHIFPNNNIIIVTEESSSSNDSKLFHKIPKICEIENLKCISVTEMLKYFVNIFYQKL